MRCKKWKLARTPLETIHRTMESLAIDAEELASRGCLQRSRFLQVVEGVAPITRDICRGLERAVGEKWPFLSEHDSEDRCYS